MSIFNNERLAIETFKMTEEVKDGLKRGWYSDEYFNNNVAILEQLSREGYEFGNDENDLKGIVDVSSVKVGDMEIEMQFFTRRKPFSVVVGVDEALAILKQCTGYFDENGEFVNTYNELEVEAVHDGEIVTYDGDPLNVRPVLKVRGKYRYFGHLETPLLGVLAEPTRIATNVYNTLVAANGKQILFFPARFAHYKVQGIHGYAYWVAMQRYEKDYGHKAKAYISTTEQGDWWGGKAGGTIAHISIVAFLGNTAKTMLEFCRTRPVEIPRIALIDFHNDCIGETEDVLDKMWEKYWEAYRKDTEEAEKYRLFAVRPDTGGNMRDKQLEPLYMNELDFGVNPRLVDRLRKSIDKRYEKWLSQMSHVEFEKAKEVAREYCQSVKIVVTGGFNVEKIRRFEQLEVPVDMYGVGSSILENSSATNNDFTADGVRVKVNNEWYDLSKVGRGACDNSQLKNVNLDDIK